MCWITYKKEFSMPKIAEDNIVSNKVVYLHPYNIVKSIYFDFNYEINVCYELDKEMTIKKDIDDSYTVRNGFHSYSVDIKYQLRKDSYEDLYLQLYYGKIINNCCGLMDYSRLYDGFGNIKEQIALASCIIPKGATYFLNETGEYVSNKIKILSVFKIGK